ncbi:MAG: hypothetical protein KDD92_04230 [Caldilineaceae bacterium]|nr:hypothetical protein [Caldilineaceae bacterium]
MIELKWIRGFGDPVLQVEEALNYSAVASPAQWNDVWLNPAVSFRKSPRYSSSPGALAAWLRKGEIEVQSIHCSSYEPKIFEGALKEIRELTSEPPNVFEPQMKTLCAKAGVAVVLVPQLSQTKVSGEMKLKRKRQTNLLRTL